jgi:hypothetical protein
MYTDSEQVEHILESSTRYAQFLLKPYPANFVFVVCYRPHGRSFVKEISIR